MSRPKKQQKHIFGGRAFDEQDGCAAHARQGAIDRLRTDPLHDQPFIAMTFAKFVLGRGEDAHRGTAGDILLDMVEKLSADDLERAFAHIIRMKRNVEYPHRNAYGYFAYVRFIEEAGREPSKKELKEYILTRREIYKDAPECGDKKGWSRLWNNAGLDGLANR